MPPPRAIPETPRRSDTSRDQRRDVKLMRRLGYSVAQIEAELNLSSDQIRYAISHPDSPKKRPGRPTTLSGEQIAQLEAFITASSENERLAFDKIPEAMGWSGKVGTDVIRRALQKLGYRRQRSRPLRALKRMSVSPAAAAAAAAVAAPRTPTRNSTRDSTQDPADLENGPDEQQERA